MGPRKAPSAGTAYLVMDFLWYSLPAEVRKAVYWGFNNVYNVRGKSYMRLEGVDIKRVPKKLDLVDAVAQIYPEARTATKALKDNINDQISQLPDYHFELPKKYFDPVIKIGRSFALKDPLKDGKGGKAPHVFCVSESAISFTAALGTWRLYTSGERRKSTPWKTKKLMEHIAKQTRVEWVKGIPVAAQKWFGLALGRMIAHEVWHQIYSLDKLVSTTKRNYPYWTEHPYSFGLEGPGGGRDWYKNDLKYGFGGPGASWIVSTMPKLKTLQGTRPSYAIERRRSG